MEDFSTARAAAPRNLITYVIISLAALAATVIPARAQPDPSSSARALASDQVPATVTAWNRPLAVLRTSLGSTTAEQRAAAASARIESAIERLSPDEVRYSVVPIVIGDGISFFSSLNRDVPLHLLEAKVYKNGIVALRHEVRK